MEALFWGCLFGGVLYAIVSVIFGDFLSSAFDGALDFLASEGYGWLQPTSLVGGITAFGGAGLLLQQYSPLTAGIVLVIAGLVAIVAGGGVYFLYVKPMSESENSTAVSIHDFTGRLGEVLVPIPAIGCGEVLMPAGAGFSNQIAASFDGEPIPSGVRVVVIEVKEHTLYVSQLEI
ncbi:hypothetical protein [Paenibacillus sp. Leaf72]|uniref:hypothetical protein n=1 Tax=Paenibacillus sp. Leaf72 TaxID=1736234 RepID=UPI0006FD5747|nr:hypothetical protein [Paenibacillus sp. Leaf72]KQO04572.1 protease [Paenibacillus sp. Leaf72]